MAWLFWILTKKSKPFYGIGKYNAKWTQMLSEICPFILKCKITSNLSAKHKVMILFSTFLWSCWYFRWNLLACRFDFLQCGPFVWCLRACHGCTHDRNWIIVCEPMCMTKSVSKGSDSFDPPPPGGRRWLDCGDTPLHSRGPTSHPRFSLHCWTKEAGKCCV